MHILLEMGRTQYGMQKKEKMQFSCGAASVGLCSIPAKTHSPLLY